MASKNFENMAEFVRLLNERVPEVDAFEPHDFNVKVTFLGSG